MSTVRASQAAAPSEYDRGFFGHPRGLSTLFFTEMWERFSYYGMRALLILFMTAAPAAGGLGFDVGTAGAVYGLYTSMVYLTSLPGGWIAERVTVKVSSPSTRLSGRMGMLKVLRVSPLAKARVPVVVV